MAKPSELNTVRVINPTANAITMPAFSQLDPKIVWLSMTAPQRKSISRYSGLNGHWQRLCTEHTFPQGYYSCQSTAQTYFVKVLLPEHGNRTIAADHIVSYLAQHNFIVNRLIEYRVLDLAQGSFFILVYPQLEFRLSDFSSADISALATVTAKIHQLLRHYPQQQQVQRRSGDKHQKLVAHWQLLLDQPDQLNKLPHPAQLILQAHRPSLLNILQIESQVIHGDLNVGNILFTQQTLPCIIDFEDCLTSWASPLQDVAFIIERFILIQHQPQKFTELLTLFLERYLAKLACPLIIDNLQRQPALISQILQALAVKTLVILAQQNHGFDGINLPDEWNKFIQLYQLSVINEPLVTQLTQAVVNSLPLIPSHD
ncbi:MAG: aminoglycoside phosphotransferase family protein [Gammaproteobacteria bacterium]|nr:aminoglycoside phosphotransferase family protein [Gammaproteobacteria bacterium]